jgi:hypothetical protein
MRLICCHKKQPILKNNIDEYQNIRLFVDSKYKGTA